MDNAVSEEPEDVNRDEGEAAMRACMNDVAWDTVAECAKLCEGRGCSPCADYLRELLDRRMAKKQEDSGD